MALIAHASVEAFFQEVVAEAMESQQVTSSGETEFYIVSLLGDFTKQRLPDEPLSVKLAQSADLSERVKNLKQVGDTSLYVTGFFAESLERQLVGADYYKEIGQAAYHELAVRLPNSTVASVYHELAEKFPRFVDVLNDVRRHVTFAGGDVVQLFEEWRKTRSEWIEKRLRALGVFIPGNDSDDGGFIQ